MATRRSQIEEVRAIRSSRDRVARLLSRYPDVSDQHRREILDFLKEGRHIDIGLLTANDNVRPRLDAFMADHRRHFQIDLFDMVKAVAVIAAAMLVLALLWEIVRPV
ncbi:MAG TPA: hypothetical protein VHN55_05525 [Sphingomicrobium sp.]|nr:hypothetical protein [Sphingomicrobium sp.]